MTVFKGYIKCMKGNIHTVIMYCVIFIAVGQAVLKKLRMTDVNLLSPIEALNLLAELKQDLQE